MLANDAIPPSRQLFQTIKPWLAITLCGAALTLAGCTFLGTTAVLSPVGPAPTESLAANGNGSLQVYSAHAPTGPDVIDREWVWNNDWTTELLFSPARSDYALYNDQGTLIQWVRNARNQYDPIPTRVSLPPGQYEIEADADGDGGTFPVRVPVVIKSGLTTQVHLGDGWQPNHTDTQDMVRLPNGDIAGWRANP
ncbi:MAG TPA: hypothetical protein VMP11_01020 [Verrucomicrobiae bacterium]|nr:hypothetical protein [Verrucomicrobiae bacterium]